MSRWGELIVTAFLCGSALGMLWLLVIMAHVLAASPALVQLGP